MKKVNLWLVLIALLSLTTSVSYAELSRVYRSEEFNFAFSVPDEWVYDDSEEYETFRLGTDVEKKDAVVILMAADLWSMFKAELNAAGYIRADVNIALWSKDVIAESFEISADTIQTIVLGKYTYYVYYVGGKLCYANIDNGYMYIFMYSGKNSYIEEVENVIKTVIHDAKGTPDKVQIVHTIEQQTNISDSWVYTDAECNCTFMIPNNWVQADKKDKWECITDKFSLAKDGPKSHSMFVYAASDIWSMLLEEEKIEGITRKDVNNAILTPSYFMDAFGVMMEDISIIDIGEYKYYQFCYNGLDTYIHVENGYIYMFMFSGNEEYIDEVENVIKTVRFN